MGAVGLGFESYRLMSTVVVDGSVGFKHGTSRVLTESVASLVVSLMLSGLITGGVRGRCAAGTCRKPRVLAVYKWDLAPHATVGEIEVALR